MSSLCILLSLCTNSTLEPQVKKSKRKSHSERKETQRKEKERKEEERKETYRKEIQKEKHTHKEKA